MDYVAEPLQAAVPDILMHIIVGARRQQKKFNVLHGLFEKLHHQATNARSSSPQPPNPSLDRSNREHRRNQRGGQRQEHRNHREGPPEAIRQNAPRQHARHTPKREDYAESRDTSQGRAHRHQPVRQTKMGIELVRHRKL